MTTPTVLDREMYSEAEAARLLRLPQSTLNYWLEGGERRGRLYRPVIRVEPRGERAPVTWAEFVEAGLLRTYRRRHNVPMAELRAFIDRLRDRYGVPYPLADRRPFVVDLQLVHEAQDEAQLQADFCLVAEVRGQFVLTAPSDEHFHRVTWANDIAVAWRPHDDAGSPVRCAPDQRFGRPAVGGISTEVIWEHSVGGEDDEEIAEAFDLALSDVEWALAYEKPFRTAS
ncbi:DUF433 domain-containing protein [uncultured Pseudonocardia sp.]|uniref:DUF433 domain-containing protein n=1 Tax=uncultured Pseudonocardia sp. TaxID=211455 RepID=UPI00262D3BFC|nr:DUF433 domain-containing protein [uncultured Pseudonocardia sp.]